MCSDDEEDVCTPRDLYLKVCSLCNDLQDEQHNHGYAFRPYER